ncbi:MAG: lipopolysaccharide transport periplasmic protein LptA [bacterium]
MSYQNSLKSLPVKHLILGRFWALGRFWQSLLLSSALLTTPMVWGLASDADQPIHIEGDDAQLDQANETITYIGSVEVVQGTLRVQGDRMVVKISGDQVKRITTVGSPARYQQQLEDDKGQVTAHADSIIYHTAEERVYLNGSATLTQQGNELQGESIRYDIVKGKVDASAGDKPGRVKMIVQPGTQQGTRQGTRPAEQ